MNLNRRVSTKTFVSFVAGSFISSAITSWVLSEPGVIPYSEEPHGKVTRTLDGKTTSYTADCEVTGKYGFPVICDVSIEAGPVKTRDVIVTLGPNNNASIFVGTKTELFEYTQKGETLTLTHLDSEHSWVFHDIYETGFGVFK